MPEWEQAVTFLESAGALAEAGRARLNAAIAYQLRKGNGDARSATVHLRKACSIFRQIGAESCLEQAQERLQRCR